MISDDFRLSPALVETVRSKPDLRFVVTGGRGWIGRALLELLDRCLGAEGAARIVVLGSADGSIRLASGRTLPVSPLATIATLPEGPSIFAHFAFLTKEKVASLPLSSFVEGNRAIADQVIGAVRRLRPLGLVMPSSGAARFVTDDFAANPYGAMKLADETAFATLCADEGVRFSCPRLYNLAGPFINKVDSYVLACIIRDVQAKRPILLRARRPVIRSYVHVRDLVNVCLSDLLLAAPQADPVFETAGEVEVEVSDLARRVAGLLGSPDHPIERAPSDPDATPDRYVGDPALWRARLAHHGIEPALLDAQIVDTAEYLAAREDL